MTMLLQALRCFGFRRVAFLQAFSAIWCCPMSRYCNTEIHVQLTVRPFIPWIYIEFEWNEQKLMTMIIHLTMNKDRINTSSHSCSSISSGHWQKAWRATPGSHLFYWPCSTTTGQWQPLGFVYDQVVNHTTVSQFSVDQWQLAQLFTR